MPVTLGEFLSSAEQLFAVAEADSSPVGDHSELAIQARRLVATLGQYMDNTVPSGHDQGAWRQAAAGLRAELRAAEGYLNRVIPPADHPLRHAEAPADPATERYARAVDALVAGNDLLRTHMTTDLADTAAPRSDWAQFLTAEPVAAALAIEITGWAERARRMAGRITHVPTRHLAELDLAAARDRLAAAARTDQGSWHAGARRDLLLVIPAAISPERIIPTAGESDADLCAGIAVSAQRLRMAAFSTAREPGTSPALSGPAWRRTAHASAIICDLAVQALDVLAVHPGADEISPERLRDAASSFGTARDAWRTIARMWQFITTDTTSPVSRTTTDAMDLVVRLGRLTFGQPDWTPSSARKPRPRSPGSLAAGSLPAVLGAVHEAADAISRMARADLAAIGAVGQAGRLYMEAKNLGEIRTGYRYVPAPADRVHILKNACYLCAGTSWQAASALDDPVLKTKAPSKALALIRAVSPQANRVKDPEIGFVLDPDLFARQATVLFTRPRGARGRHGEHLDLDALIHAYDHEHLSLQECAERFVTSYATVRKILTDHGVRLRKSGEWQAGGRDEPGLRTSFSMPEADEDAPVYRQLRSRGISDPTLLNRAALVDQAAADVIKSASRHRTEPESPDKDAAPASRSPAALAAQDGPNDATEAVRHAAAQRPQAQEPAQPPRRAQEAPRSRPQRR